MGAKTGIEWTDATWNPVRGFSRVSEGCRNCYAETVAARFSGPGMPYEGLAKRVGGEARWTGVVRMVPKHLADPLRWRKPRRIFVNSMSDLFHERLSFEQIAAIFGVMAAAERHSFQVLTKRPKRAIGFFSWLLGVAGTRGYAEASRVLAEARERHGAEARSWSNAWPLPNVWLGVSVEDQETADERIPLLLQTPAAVRFVSYEPALGPVDFVHGDHRRPVRDWLRRGEVETGQTSSAWVAGLDWIIVGGESGNRARPFDIRWAERVVEQCGTAGVACFVKQLGARPVLDEVELAEWPTAEWTSDTPGSGLGRAKLNDSHGGDWSEWPERLRVRQFPNEERRP